MKKNPVRAFSLFTRAAAKNDVLGHFGAGYCYYSGNGVKRNIKAAETSLRKAAALGNSDAMLLLFNIYRYGWNAMGDPNSEFQK